MVSSAPTPRMTQATQSVLRALLDKPAEEKYGLEVCAAAGLPSGTVHPIFARLEGIGWLESRWEDVDPAQEGRPRRRYYRLTRDGAEQARISLAQSSETKAALQRLRPGIALGGQR
jgi:PadR family transcriptional regulator, regulatory protein PadR